MIVIEKNKDGSRKISDAIESGINLYGKHSEILAQELIAYVSPKIYLDSELEGKTFSIDVASHKGVPYGTMLVCKKGEEDERNKRSK
jgi:hypothetical protein